MVAKLRALSKDEEIAAIPSDQPVLVQIPPDASAFAASDDDGGTVLETVTPETQDDGAKVLKEQLAASEAAAKLDREAREKSDRDAADARRLADERSQEISRLQTSQRSNEQDLIESSLAGAQSEASAAEAEYVKAYNDGDPAAMAKAQSKIGRASAKIINLEGAAAEIATRKEREAANPRQETKTTPALDTVSAINANAGLMPEEKTWLIAHQDAVIDPARNRELGVAYERATRAGHVRGTPAYFSYLNEFMGYEKPAPKTQNGNGSDDERDTIVAAPVSRENTSSTGQRLTATQVELSPEQRELIRNMGLKEKDYAKQVLILNRDKKDNPERYGR